MTRPLAITSRQARTLIKAATEGNAIIEVETEIGIVRLIPAVLDKRKENLDDERPMKF